MRGRIFFIVLFAITSTSSWGQFIFDDYFCEDYGNFKPFEYDIDSHSFTIKLSETCDPSADGSFDVRNLMTSELKTSQQNSSFTVPTSDFTEGKPMHYCFRKRNGTHNSNDPNGTAYAGVKLNHDEFKGGFLILINGELLSRISSVFEAYKLALIGDGWSVTVLPIKSTDSIPAIKRLIKEMYLSMPELRSVFIIGDVPIPYSGQGIRPDGHEEHAGAWMADVYYADLDDDWTDVSVNDSESSYERHRNIPGDGKFDQTFCPSPTELEIGRIYFENLPIFTETPQELYERYLTKDINYRTGKTHIDKEYILQSQQVYPDIMLKDLWLLSGTATPARKFAQTENMNLVAESSQTSYRFGFGDSYGSPTSCNNIVTSQQFKEDSLQVSFITFSGSYFGNWSYDNTLLSVACASKGNTIAATWGVFTNPLHYLNSGQTFGFCQRMSMRGYNGAILGQPNWSGFNNYPSHTVSNMLIGDPSLKTYILPKLESLSVSNMDSLQINLQWAENTEGNILGYNVYRTSSLTGDFVRLNSDYIKADGFVDFSPLVGDNFYMVRAVRLDSGSVASFYTYSTGIIDSIDFQFADSDLDGYAANEDCDDRNPNVNPGKVEIAYNGLDDDCNPETRDDDLDNDGFVLAHDCDDNNPNINPGATEIADNGIDEDCDGMDLITSSVKRLCNATIEIYPNPVSDLLHIQIIGLLDYRVELYDFLGKLISIGDNSKFVSVKNFPPGTYILKLSDLHSNQYIIQRIVVIK